MVLQSENLQVYPLSSSAQYPDWSALSPRSWPFSLDWLPRATYLVGGNVRDALLGRHADYLDLDFVLPEGAVAIATAIAHYHRAGFVLLDAERQIARVVFDNATVDFAQQVGDSLEEDLQRRDFTVNAIAYNPHTEQLLDPLQGYADLQRRLIRMIAPDNLKEDPLRLLRAYRQAAQLGFSLDPATRSMIQQLAGLLQFIAAERIQGELNYLLGTAHGTPLLTMAGQDGLLDVWLPHTDRLSQIGAIDRATGELETAWAAKGFDLRGWFRDQPKASGTGRSWLKVAKLASLVATDLPTAEQELWRLKYSRAEVQTVVTLLRLLPQMNLALQPLSSATLRQQYQIFRHSGAAFPALALLTVATGTDAEAIAPLIQRFLTPDDPVAHPTPLLSGRELMTALALPPGPQIGQLLEKIQLAQADGTLVTRQDALDFAQRVLSAGDL